MQAYSNDQLVYVDEAGVDDTEAYACGWCAQSERFEAVKLGHRTQRISMIAAWCQRQVVAPLTFTGSCDTALVETWVQQCLVEQLKPGQVVVMGRGNRQQMLGLQTEVRSILRELADMRRQQGDN